MWYGLSDPTTSIVVRWLQEVQKKEKRSIKDRSSQILLLVAKLKKIVNMMMSPPRVNREKDYWGIFNEICEIKRESIIFILAAINPKLLHLGDLKIVFMDVFLDMAQSFQKTLKPWKSALSSVNPRIGTLS